MSHDSNVLQVAAMLGQSPRTVVFTGAGISTESGIPDFRSPGGVWARFQPVDFQDFLTSGTARHEHWRQKGALYPHFRDAQPNAGHLVLARWEACGVLSAVITQNIDGLHQAAGSRRVLELHGTARAIECLSCAARFEPESMIEEFLATDVVPDCPHCGGWLKTSTVSFGQTLPEQVLAESVELSRASNLFLAIGSSLVVEPAASLPIIAKRAGAKLVIVNRDPTDQDESADVVLRDSIGGVLTAIDRAIDQLGSTLSSPSTSSS